MFTRLLAALSLSLACHFAHAAESAGAAESTEKPAASPAPKAKTSPSKPPAYDELPYSTLLQKAEKGDRAAQFELGSRYNYGRDLPKNTREAMNWLRKAAAAGHVEAQRLLAVKLFEGHDVAVDHEEAFLWTQRLADTGDRPGQLMLANLYANGEGTPRDLKRAYMWLDVAATPERDRNPNEAARTTMETAATERDKLASLLLPNEEAEAQQLASDWWQAHRLAKQRTAKIKKKAGKPAQAAPAKE